MSRAKEATATTKAAKRIVQVTVYFYPDANEADRKVVALLASDPNKSATVRKAAVVGFGYEPAKNGNSLLPGSGVGGHVDPDLIRDNVRAVLEEVLPSFIGEMRLMIEAALAEHLQRGPSLAPVNDETDGGESYNREGGRRGLFKSMLVEQT